MTVAEGAITIDDDRSIEDADETAHARSRRRADRTGVADRPRQNRSPAAQRAIDRRRKRATQRSTATIAGRRHPDQRFFQRVTTSPGDLFRRVPFVVLVIGILSVGLGLTLWLSTTAAQDSYQLSVARQNNQDLSDRRDALKKEFELGDSAPEIADKATKQGMIPAKDVARFVVGPNGKGTIVGDITAATGTAAPSMNAGSTGNTVAPQPGSTTADNTAQAPAVVAPGADLSGSSGEQSSATAPIAANVLPQNATGASQTSTTPRQAGSQPTAAQLPR